MAKKELFRQELEEINGKLTSGNLDRSENISDLYSRQSQLINILDLYQRIEDTESKIGSNKSLLEETKDSGEDIELQQIAKEDIELYESQIKKLQEDLQLLLIPPDPNDSKNCIIEIRAGVGGEEASLFAQDLFRMYTRYASIKNWQSSLMSISSTSNGGIKEVIFKIAGKSIFSQLKYESGIHRVQRVPETESQGRIHTSAVSVVVMPEVTAIEVKVDPSDIKIDVYRSSGHGGQSVNTTDSAVRITHLPTNIVVTCQQTKDQIRNKETALSILRTKLYNLEIEKQNKEIGDIRKNSIKTGDRSDKIKTYNFPQGRLTDHRIKKSWFGIDKILSGEIEDILNETKLELSKIDYA